MTTTAQFPATTARRSHFDGQVLTPGTRGYDSARSVWNGMIDHRPALIVRCASVDDVVTAVRTARERDLEIGVRCGGHNIAGLAVPHGGLMIDLTPLDRVTVDPVTRRARVQGGAMLGALDRATQPLRPRHDGRQRLAHRRRRADARWRHGLAGPPARPRLRQRRVLHRRHRGRRRRARVRR